MDLITPDLGIFFWQTVTLAVVLFILGKFAWKPILQILKEREVYIEQSLQSAQEAQRIVAQMKQEQDQLLEQAMKEREKIIREAVVNKTEILKTAALEAKQLGDRVLQDAREVIVAEKEMAFSKLKQEVVALSIHIAEKLLATELHTDQKQEDLVKKFLHETKIN
jgi:F-type H+-transporting ATPase subunit b